MWPRQQEEMQQVRQSILDVMKYTALNVVYLIYYRCSALLSEEKIGSTDKLRKVTAGTYMQYAQF